MNKFTDIKISMDNLVAIVEICRPPHNFFDLSLILQIAEAFETLDQDSNCRAIVLASEGKAFCAGANFGSGQAGNSGSGEFTEKGFQNTTGKLYSEATRLFRSLKPIVAAIQGPAIGGGLGLSMVADFRVGCDSSRFSANFVKLGLHQGFGITQTLPLLIGQQKANDMLLSGRRISGQEALEIGLLDELAPEDKVRQRALALAYEISQNAPLAVSSVRSTMRDGIDDQVSEITKHELAEQQKLRKTKDAYEGIKAVSERRRGVFSGI
ncbi:enoyl-CoA hydratase/isomerase family protein [Gammaproteobacteria bacterium]|nr:enoyl-CoA hydratase/isomerase family protein [Gammaproteobacteria bacterium]